MSAESASSRIPVLCTVYSLVTRIRQDLRVAVDGSKGYEHRSSAAAILPPLAPNPRSASPDNSPPLSLSLFLFQLAFSPLPHSILLSFSLSHQLTLSLSNAHPPCLSLTAFFSFSPFFQGASSSYLNPDVRSPGCLMRTSTSRSRIPSLHFYPQHHPLLIKPLSRAHQRR